jgi:hypothetical protein
VGVDFAFAPGEESRLKMLQQLLRDRTDGGALDTTLIESTGVTTIAEFIRNVDTSQTLPTGDLVLGSHGNDTGWMEIDLDAAADRVVSYKVLKEAWDDVARRNRLRIPPDMYTKADGTRAPVRVLIKGCRIGQAPKFVDGLKLLFGGQVPVVAPKHFFAVRPSIKTRGKRKVFVGRIGSFEHLAYSQEVISPTELKRADLLAAYRAKSFTQIDGTPMPDLWDTWLPKDVGVRKEPLPLTYTVSLGREIEGMKTLSGMAQFRHSTFKYTKGIGGPSAADKTRNGFKQWLAGQPEFQATWGPTGFPLNEQLGPPGYDAFFDSFTWTPSTKAAADPFIWVGVRHEYNVLLPVVAPPLTGKKADRLLYNFFPPRGTAGTILELPDTDSRLFYTTP